MPRRRKSNEFDMRTNLKAKEGSQGTLFSGGEHTDAKWHRGYTPERQAAVRDAFDMSGAPWKRNRANAEIADTVARSTAPIEHLHLGNGLQIHGNQAMEDRGRYYHKGLGTQSWSEEKRAKAKSSISIQAGQERTSTVLHEIGHHVSHHSTDSLDYTTAKSRGAEEARADDYAATHFRDRRGNPEPRPTYAGGQTNYEAGRTAEFFDSYHQNRETPNPQRPSHAEMDERWRQHIGIQDQVRGQMALIVKVSDGRMTPGEKFKMRMNDEAMP